MRDALPRVDLGFGLGVKPRFKGSVWLYVENGLCIRLSHNAKPGRVHAQYRIDLPRPRRRTEAQLQSWKERILEDLDLAKKGADAEPEFAI